MIIDCFTFFNELDLLEIRLATLSPVVDKFVLVEAGKTQTLKDKPFYFNENKARFSKYLDKIVHVMLNEYPSNEGNLWAMENFQRNAIKKGLEEIKDLQPSDFVMISDVDEIPEPRIVRTVERYMSETSCLAVDMSFHAYFANLVSPNKGWIGTVVVRKETLDVIDPQDIRNIKDQCPRVENAGWHLSWLGGWERAYEKLNSCIEPLDKSEVPSKEEFKRRFEERIKDGGFFHLTTEDDTVPLVVNNFVSLPDILINSKEYYKHLFF